MKNALAVAKMFFMGFDAAMILCKQLQENAKRDIIANLFILKEQFEWVTADRDRERGLRLEAEKRADRLNTRVNGLMMELDEIKSYLKGEK